MQCNFYLMDPAIIIVYLLIIVSIINELFSTLVLFCKCLQVSHLSLLVTNLDCFCFGLRAFMFKKV